MGADIVALMKKLGHERFRIAGHDRGGRVAYRLALDHPERVEKLAVLDIVPTGEMWSGMDAARAMQVYHWMFLAQPEPLPETLIARAPREYVDHTLASWTGDKSLDCFADALADYRAAFADPQRIHAMCEDYRAGATIDRDHDRRATSAPAARSPRRCSRSGAITAFPPPATSPLDIWRGWAENVRGHGVPGGHFLPEESPGRTLRALIDFFS